MSHGSFWVGSVAVLITLAGRGPAAQHAEHAAQSPATSQACATAAQEGRAELARLRQRLESARQSNDPARLRAAVDEIDLAMAALSKTLADCFGNPAAPPPSAPEHAAEVPAQGLAGHASHPAGHPMAVPGKVTVRITDDGFEPASVSVTSGVPLELTFLRVSDKTCGTEVVIPGLSIRRDLPLNVPVTVTFTPDTAGEIIYSCGMNMLRGTIIVAQP